ncbi:MAG: Ig-like domain-containing protein [Verrucomicrobia bacterium]|nr:Ig-like domain-containing protein [Verrucomicrobiota bacterium]
MMLRIACGLCAVAVFVCSTGSALEPPRAAVAWFTDAAIDAAIDESVKVAAPDPVLPAAKGGWGAAVQLTKGVPVEHPVLFQEQGYISFWIRPDWNGNDGKTHRLLHIGDPERNGLLLEKSAKNTLRYVMASPAKSTVARADVSHWKAGEWHHVAIAWFSNGRGIPAGVPLWIDKEAVDGPIASGNAFLDPDAMSDARLWIGDETAQAAMDELVMRYGPETPTERRPLEVVYRDYFRTAPYTQIAIDPEPHGVPSDRRVVNGYHKQYGVQAQLNGRWERITEYVDDHGYGNWATFDAKPLIAWSTSDEAVATVNAQGRVFGHALGRCTVTAEFRGLRASETFEVIALEQPDFDLYVVERLPRYHKYSIKGYPVPGDVVKSVAHIANYGFEPTPAGVPVTFELIPDSNRNFALDADERPVLSRQVMIDMALEPFTETTVEFEWTWPEEPVWVRVTVDPEDGVAEICEANNQLVEINTGRQVIWGYVDDVYKRFYAEKRINLVGSFSLFDWMRTQSDQLRIMLRRAVYSTTSPVGVETDIRVDEFIDFIPGTGPNRPYEWHLEYQDGGFPIGEDDGSHLDAIWSPVVHELGHTMLSLPDLYGYACSSNLILIADGDGTPYAGGPLLPTLGRRGTSILFSPELGVACGTGYSSLMDMVHLWLHPANAGQIQYYLGQRGVAFWGIHGRLIAASRHELYVLDLNDEPLVGAAVYCYQVTNVDTRQADARLIADRPKFKGHTDKRGCFVFPKKTDPNWDDPETDEVDGSVEVWNPFGTATGDIAATPGSWGTDSMLLLKIVSGDQTEFHWLTISMMNVAFFEGGKDRGVYPIRTSLKPHSEPTPLVRKPVPEAIREQNLAPVAKLDGPRRIRVRPGEMIRLDGSASYDPEGQPLLFRWHADGPVKDEDRFCEKAIYEGAAPSDPRRLRDYDIVFQVVDGVRKSESICIEVELIRDEGSAEEDD